MADFGKRIYRDVASKWNGHGAVVEHGHGDCVTVESIGTSGRFAVINGPALRDALIEAFPFEDEKSEPEEVDTDDPIEVGDVVRIDYPGIEGTRGVIVEALPGDTFAVEFHSGHAEVYASGWLQHVHA